MNNFTSAPGTVYRGSITLVYFSTVTEITGGAPLLAHAPAESGKS
jgi:hypothetical protein